MNCEVKDGENQNCKPKQQDARFKKFCAHAEA